MSCLEAPFPIAGNASLSLHPTSLASSGQMLHPPQAPDEAR